MNFTRKCSNENCNVVLTYVYKYQKELADKKSQYCKICSGLKTSQTHQNRYIQQPKKCPVCYQDIPWHKRKNKTCSEQCRVKQIKTTKEEIYGNPGYNNREKSIITLMNNFGVENVSQIPEVKRKKDEKGYWFSKIDVSGENNPHFGYSHSIETKQILREKSLKRAKNVFSISAGMNPEGCKIIDQYGKENGYNFQHGMNGGEFLLEALGYWADGYDKEKNVWIEYYEKFHYSKNALKEKDIVRRNMIIRYLNCKFISIKYDGTIEIFNDLNK